ncbi:MAG: extracellular solute-binding protein [Halioglobus sp.]
MALIFSKHYRLKGLLSTAALLILTACGGEDANAPLSEDVIDNTEEVQAYYAANSGFFAFKTIEDLPDDLSWQSGEGMPEMGSPNAKKGGTEYRALQDFPRTLRTLGPDSNGGFRSEIWDDVAMRLAFRHQDEFDLVPGLAREWALGSDGRTTYLRLDPEARFSDGEPVTADDYFFMFWFYRSPYITAPWYNNYYSTMYTNITRYDDLTFSITTTSGKPDADSKVLELVPIAEHFYKEVGPDFVERYQWRVAPTTGAYLVESSSIKKGRSIALNRVKDWWAKDKKHYRYRYNTDRIQFTVIRDTEKIFEAFRRGDLDQSSLNLAEYWYEKLPNDNADVQAGYIHKSVFYNQRPRPNIGLWMNTSRHLLDNKDVRLGIHYATNWQLVIDQFFRGDYTRLKTAEDGFGEFSHPTLVARQYNVEKALEHFAKAGFTERGADGILVNGSGERLAFTVSTGYQTMKDVLTILKEEAAKAGVDFRVEMLDGTAGWKKVQEKQHEIHLAGFGAFLEMYPRFWEHFASVNAYDVAFLDDGSVNPQRKLKTQTNNLEVYASAEMDELINRYRASEDKTQMTELAHKMQELHHQSGSYVPGFYQGFFRVGHWRWVKYPEFFTHKHANGAGQLYVHWIDSDLKKATLQARKEGETFEPAIRVYDQWKN